MAQEQSKELILVVDDNEFSAVYIEELLGDRYQVASVSDGELGVATAIALKPSLVLMDVEMPGMDGYAACQRIKEASETRDIPVLFVSAKVEPSDRLAGYEVGGDDYITKPFTPNELVHKIDVLLRYVHKNRSLTDQANEAVSTAMTAMSTVGDVGVIMRFLNELVSCLDYDAVMNAVFQTMSSFGLSGSVQLRNDKTVVSRSSEGLCSPLEESVLSNMATCARIVDVGHRSAFNFPCVTIIVRDMPKHEPEHYGRIKDNMATIAESVDVHIRSLALIDGALRRGDTLLRLLQRTVGSLQEIDQSYRRQRAESSQILNDLVHQIENSFVHLGLTEGQERFLQNTLRNAVDQSQSLSVAEIEADQAMKALNTDLGRCLSGELAGLQNNPVEEGNRIELF